MDPLYLLRFDWIDSYVPLKPTVYNDIQSLVRFVDSFITNFEGFELTMNYIVSQDWSQSLIESCDQQTYYFYLALDEQDKKTLLNVYSTLMNDYIPPKVVENFIQYPVSCQLKFQTDINSVEKIIVALGGRLMIEEFKYRLGV